MSQDDFPTQDFAPKNPAIQSTSNQSEPSFELDTIRTPNPNSATDHESSSPRSPAQSLNKNFGNYVIERLIAKGGMGVVYRARHRLLGRTVALKVIRSEGPLSREVMERFQAEAIAAAGLEHPGIVPLYEVGIHEGQPFIAMAFVEGESLANRIKESCLAPREAARIMERVARAVAHAHQKGIIHRDIKPQNILMTVDNNPLLTDFGLAKQTQGADNSLTIDGQILGTPSYMPPEQAVGSKYSIGPTSDVYALGATLYCLLTGRPPFVAESVTAVLHQVTTVEPVSPSKLNHKVPRDLETICLKCLQKNPDQRYPSVLALANDLARFQEHQPILARRANVVERSLKWTRRNPALTSMVAFLLILALGGLGYYISLPGYLKLHVEPSDAQVAINGEQVSTTNGDVLYRSSPEHYKIRVSKPGYRDFEKDVVLVRGSANTLYETVVLESLSGYMRVVSDPPGANVEILDGQGRQVDKGVTPYNSKLLPSGRYRTTVSKSLYKTVSIAGEVPSGGRVNELAAVKLVPQFEYSESYQNFLSRLNLLEQPTKSRWEFNQVPLINAMKRIEELEGVTIIIDANALGDAGISLDSPVSLSLGKLSLQKSLAFLLKSVELEYRPALHDGKLTLYVGLEEEQFETVVFPVEEVVMRGDAAINGRNQRNFADYSSLLHLIERSIDSTSWESAGGYGTMIPEVQSSSVVVKQSWKNLVEVEYVLRSLKQGAIKNQAK
ncbi:MAG: serine/threonine protein kinase [Planctomycetes bacterium]|nr:serine/threonine protein kinase [Planctomycetota bacterium]